MNCPPAEVYLTDLHVVCERLSVMHYHIPVTRILCTPHHPPTLSWDFEQPRIPPPPNENLVRIWDFLGSQEY